MAHRNTTDGAADMMEEDEEADSAPAVRNDLRAALQFAVTQICVEEDQRSGEAARTSPGAVLALSELAYLYSTRCLAPDVAAFSSHAGRKTIGESDVLLVARKNRRVHRALLDFCQQSHHAALTRADTTDANNSTARRINAKTPAAAAANKLSKAKRSSLTVFSPSAAPLGGGGSDNDDNLSSSSDDDAPLRGPPRGLAPAANRCANAAAYTAADLLSSDDDDGEGDGKMSTKLGAPPKASSRPPPKRFRLAGEESHSQEEEQQEEEEDDDDDAWLARARRPRAATSRIQELLATMSQDSTLS